MCIIKNGFRKGPQKQEPFVLIKPDPNGWIYGKADDVRGDNSLILVKHLDCEKALEYINTYETKNQEPRRKFESILHKNYQNGNMSLQSLQPVLTEKHWIDRNKHEITDLRVKLQAHLLKRKEKQLNRFASKSAREMISVCFCLFAFFIFYVCLIKKLLQKH